MAEPSTIFMLGLVGSGKTNFLVALDITLDDQGDPDGLVHGDLADDRAYLQPLRSSWLRGEQLERTPNGAIPPHLLMVRHPATGVTAEFAVPDMAGESFDYHFESRSLPKELGDQLVRAAGLIVFVHSAENADHEIMEDPGLVNSDAASSDDIKTEIEQWKIEHASQQARLVDLLQFIAKLNPLEAPLPVAVIVSAWDLVEKMPAAVRLRIPNDPDQFLARLWPLLNQYLANNERRFKYRIYGVSARGGGVSLKEAARLTAMSRPTDRISIVDGTNRSKDLTRPIRWILGLPDTP